MRERGIRAATIVLAAVDVKPNEMPWRKRTTMNNVNVGATR